MFPQQYDAAFAIINLYYAGLCYVLFRAEVQSGKTGAYHALIRMMFERNQIDRVYILCGSHETELRNQCHADCTTYHSPDIQSRIRVIFRQDFGKSTMDICRALIIVDETHLVAEKDQTLSRFLKKHGLSMTGTTAQMVAQSTYILSVSATPHAEESAMIYGHSHKKGYVTMYPGVGYYGPRNYYEDGHIRSTYALHDMRGKHNFHHLLGRLYERGPSYLLFRISAKNKQSVHLMRRLAEWQNQGHALNVVEYDSDKKDKDRQILLTQAEQTAHETKWGVRLPCLETAPDVMTVVLLKGRLRCGKRLPKQHVSLAWEMSKYAHTDTIVQSLLGRLSGYDVPAVRALIFIPEYLLKKHPSRVVSCSDLERYLYGYHYGEDPHAPLDKRLLALPQHASHMVQGAVMRRCMTQEREHYPCAPFRFCLPLEAVRPGAEQRHLSDSHVKQSALDILRAHPEWIDHCTVLTLEQKEEIRGRLATITVRNIHIRHYQGTSNQNMYQAHRVAFETQTASSEQIADFPFLTFCVVYGDFQPLAECRVRPVEGEVYAIFYTQAQGAFHAVHRGSRISLHDGKTHFSVCHDSVLETCVAASGYGFSTAVFADPEAFFQQMDHFIRIAKMGIGLFGRTFSSLMEGGDIRLSRGAYGNSLERLKEVCARLERTHHITICFEEKRYRPVLGGANVPPMDHGLKCIQWKDVARPSS